MPPPWLHASLGLIWLFLSLPLVHAQLGVVRQAAGPGYRDRDVCPIRCGEAGPDSADWYVYHNFGQVQSCPQAIFYDFSLHDDVDDAGSLHRIHACTSFGPDWENLPDSSAQSAAVVETVSNATYQLGWWNEGGFFDATGVGILAKQLRDYLSSGFAATNRTVLLYSQFGQATVGLYIGKGLQNEGTSSFALKTLADTIQNLDTANATNVALEMCEPGYDSSHIFGIVASSNGTFASVQSALRSWSNATCLSFHESKNITGPALLTTPLIASWPNATNSSPGNETWASSSSSSLFSRANCRTIQVESGDSCATLARKCAITAADFTKYNPKTNFCATLQPKQHVCCSSGTLPDFTPKPNADGSCATYKVQTGDSCSTIAASNSITTTQLDEFNKKTWAWNGCSNIWSGSIICLSKGSPAMPAIVANAVCGPQKSGTKAPTDGSDISLLNPCPLNACCDVWGQCGITAEFCTDTNTGAPGTAKPGTNGCISNCGTKIVRGDAPAVYRKIGYFEGFNLGSRKCLNQDARQLDGSDYTHLHFGFGLITPDYEINAGDKLTSYEFENFKQVSGPKRILSFGGWDFSTGPGTYTIFRKGVEPANRLKLATNIFNFIKKHNLDGVDIDWEYPSAPDLPDIPQGSEDEGKNYLAFLVILKNLMGPARSVSIAAPASYWYLKGFPIKAIAKVVDYIVYMTYDLHGQWDAQNKNAQEGCPSGMCLRSQVNLTETMSSLVMITKAGVPSNRVVVGVTSYGRSFKMAQAGCHTPGCFYTGSPIKSDAKPGVCTGTRGYIADAEIDEILKSPGRVKQQFLDGPSNSNILVYDDTEWVAYMDPKTKASRAALYKSLNMGGTTDWAVDLQAYVDAPKSVKSWSDFKSTVLLGQDPNKKDFKPTGNWSNIDCSSEAVRDLRWLTPSQRWKMLECDTAWKDAVDYWHEVDEGTHRNFPSSISITLSGNNFAQCNSLQLNTNCDTTLQCDGFDTDRTGAAGYEIMNSLITIHQMYANFNDALTGVFAKSINNALADFENKFAPIPPPDTNMWKFFLVDMVTFGAAMVVAPFFNSFLSTMPYFISRQAAMSTLKDSTMTIVTQSTTIAKDLMEGPDADKWTLEKTYTFSHYMGQSAMAWSKSIQSALEQLFNGKEDGIQLLTSLISDGQLIDGYMEGTGNAIGGNFQAINNSRAELEQTIAKGFFSYAMPAIWFVSGQSPFIVDSGYGCTEKNPLDSYLDKDAMATEVCYNDKLYYLAKPKGKAQSCDNHCSDNHCDYSCSDSKFAVPSGIETLNPETWGGVSIDDLIRGSVRTYEKNGKVNNGIGGETERGTLPYEAFGKDFDVTYPGLIRIPVCSVDVAFRAWNGPNNPSKNPIYPCNTPLAKSYCGDSTFIDQTSNASPKVEDCLQIIKNIEGTKGEWSTNVPFQAQRKLVQAGSCKLGVQATNAMGNNDFRVGAQDIIDLITDSIAKFARDGKVGSKGKLKCKGNAIQQDVEWGLY